jgi:hypothetical protein
VIIAVSDPSLKHASCRQDAEDRPKRNRIKKKCEEENMFTVAVRISLLGKPISLVGKNISSFAADSV